MEEKDIKQISFRPSKELYEKLKKDADEQGRSLNKQVEIIVRKFYNLIDK